MLNHLYFNDQIKLSLCKEDNTWDVFAVEKKSIVNGHIVFPNVEFMLRDVENGTLLRFYGYLENVFPYAGDYEYDLPFILNAIGADVSAGLSQHYEQAFQFVGAFPTDDIPLKNIYEKEGRLTVVPGVYLEPRPSSFPQLTGESVVVTWADGREDTYAIEFMYPSTLQGKRKKPFVDLCDQLGVDYYAEKLITDAINFHIDNHDLRGGAEEDALAFTCQIKQHFYFDH